MIQYVDITIEDTPHNGTLRGTAGVAMLAMFPKNVNLCSRPAAGNDRSDHALN
jgi:hypothetical protein